MNNVISGSFAEFDPEEVIESVDRHLTDIYARREVEKQEWFDKKRKTGKVTGFWLWKKKVPYEQEELEIWWEKGLTGDWYFESPKYRIWDKWDETIRAFERIKAFCQLATDAGNMTFHLSKEDALFAYNWNV